MYFLVADQSNVELWGPLQTGVGASGGYQTDLRRFEQKGAISIPMGQTKDFENFIWIEYLVIEMAKKRIPQYFTVL